MLGSVLMIAAHPDDENTAILAYYARGRHMRTGYLSLTRGEGGQNLIGPEQGDLLGLIRSHELLEARRIDGAEQFFTRAIDFGFTKTPEETFAKWGRERILSDVVWVIRRFRPDVVILRFSGTPKDGHGQHQVSAILGKEAFLAAGDPSRFPEQLKFVEPWKARRLMFNSFSFTKGDGEGSGRDSGSHRSGYRRLQSGAGRFVQPDRGDEPQHASQPGHGGVAAAWAFAAISWCRWPATRPSKDAFDGMDTTLESRARRRGDRPHSGGSRAHLRAGSSRAHHSAAVESAHARLPLSTTRGPARSWSS